MQSRSMNTHVTIANYHMPSHSTSVYLCTCLMKLEKFIYVRYVENSFVMSNEAFP